MNREIKFRAFDKIDKEMFRVIMLTAPQGKDYLIVSGRGGSTTTKKDACVLMQYTGLRDKNDKEIYEGDILQYADERMVVVYEAPSFELQHLATRANAWDLWKGENEEVIGNIYENKELLK